MPGMHSGLNVSNPVLVAAFRSALMHQGLTALLALATLAIIWASVREWRPGLVGHGDQGRATGARRSGPAPAGTAQASAGVEPGRRPVTRQRRAGFG